MGNGTFNLEALYRRLGIKNPQPDVREFVQPVITVGDFRDLTPRLVAPTYFGGGSIAAELLEFSIIQITSRAKGGTLLLNWSTGVFPLLAGIRTTPVAGLTAVADRGPLSFEASAVLVEEGTAVADPLPGDHPEINVALRSNWPGTFDFFIPPGRFLVIASGVVNTAIPAWAVVLRDVPAAELPPA